jgi:ABC-2 type transport system permease protein
MKDMTILFRDSTFFMNCIVMSFLWPFLLLLMMGRGSSAISNIFLLLPADRLNNPVLAVSLGLGMVVTALNAIASTAISREGKQLFVMKTVPVPFGVQIVAKASAAAFMGCITCLLVVLMAVFLFKIPVVLLGRSLILGFLGAIFSAMNGVLLDLIFPKLNWDNAYKAVKQNLNVPVHMAMNTLCAAAVYLAAYRFISGSGHGFMILFMLAAGLDMAVLLAILGFGAKMVGRIDA